MREILRHSFSKLNFNIKQKSLVAIHKDSYGSFLDGDKSVGVSIAGVLSSIFPIHDLYGYATIEYVGHRLSEPNYSIRECREKTLTYSANLYGTFRLVLFSIDDETTIV